MVNISESYKNMAVKYYIENVEIPNLEETIEFYEGLAMEDAKYIEDVEMNQKTLDEYKYVLATM